MQRYAAVIYLNEKVLQKLQTMINDLVRFITKSRRIDHVEMSTLRKEIGLPSVADILKRQQLKLGTELFLSGKLADIAGSFHSDRITAKGIIRSFGKKAIDQEISYCSSDQCME